MANEWNGFDNEEERGEQDYAFQTLNRHGRPKTLGWSVASLVMGIASLIFSSFGYAGIIFGVLAIVFAVMARRMLGYFDGKVIFGIILGIFGTVFAISTLVFVYTLGEEGQKYIWDVIQKMYEDSSSVN